MQKRITRLATLENLQELRDFVIAACQDCGGDAAVCDGLELAVDEAATNVVLHGYEGLAPGPLEIVVRCDDGQAEIVLVDQGRSFSPADIPAPDLNSPWEDRRVGGLGWHLIQEMTDEVRYEADPQAGNRLILRKRLRAPD